MALPDKRLHIHPLSRFSRRLDRFLGLPPDIPADLRSNIFYYLLDISWWGLYAGATSAFLNIYATRIGATAGQIGLLTALPAAITLIISLPFAGWVRRLGAHRATWVGAFFSRLPLLLYVFLPFFPDESIQVRAILVIGAFLTIPNTLIGISFGQLMIEAIPPEWRGSVVGTRNALFSIITFIVTMISGQILTHLAFPIGYQVVFVIGFFGGIGTAYELYHVHPLAPSRNDVHPEVDTQLPRRKLWGLPPLDSQGTRYLKVLGILFLFNTVNNMISPLTPGILVNILHLSDAWISIGTAGNSLIVFLISLRIVRWTRRTGNRVGTALGSALLAFQAVSLGLARDPTIYLLSVGAGGLGSGILMTAQYNYHLDSVPENNRPGWLSLNLMSGNAAILIGSLLGPLFAGISNTSEALLIFGGMRLLMGFVIYLWG